MDVVVFGDLNTKGFEIVERDGKLYVRYDAGAHQSAWREDEITREDLDCIRSSREGEYRTMIALQRSLMGRGVDPYRPNWEPRVRSNDKGAAGAP